MTQRTPSAALARVAEQITTGAWPLSPAELERRRRMEPMAVVQAGRVRVVRRGYDDVPLPRLPQRNPDERAHARSLERHRRQRQSVTGYRGVSYHPRKQRPFRAEIWYQMRAYRLGYYLTARDAAIAYNAAAIALYGDQAVLNRISEETLQ